MVWIEIGTCWKNLRRISGACLAALQGELDWDKNTELALGLTRRQPDQTTRPVRRVVVTTRPVRRRRTIRHGGDGYLSG